MELREVSIVSFFFDPFSFVERSGDDKILCFS